MEEQKMTVESMVMNNLPTISPLTAEIIEEADEAAARAGKAMMGVDISKLTTRELVELTLPYYRESEVCYNFSIANKEDLL